MKTLVVLVLATLAAAVGEALLASGMKRFGDVSALAPGEVWRMLTAFSSGRVLGGVGLMLVFFLLFTASLSWADLSFAQPLTALSFVFGPIIAWWFLGEDVSWWRWAGTALIVAGVVLVTLDPRQLTVPGGRAGRAAGGPSR